MSSGPVFIGIKGQAGTINLIPITPPSFWQRVGGWLAWFLGRLLWLAVAFFAGWLWGAL